MPFQKKLPNKIVPHAGYIGILLTQGKIALIDEIDYPLVSGYRWYAQRHEQAFYAVACVPAKEGGGRKKMHQLLMPLSKPLMVDHRDGNGLNNRRSNLRPATGIQNSANTSMRTNNSSGFKGVCWHKRSAKWHAQLRIKGKRGYLGGFTTPELAYAAYCAADVKYHGAFSHRNTRSTTSIKRS